MTLSRRQEKSQKSAHLHLPLIQNESYNNLSLLSMKLLKGRPIKNNMNAIHVPPILVADRLRVLLF